MDNRKPLATALTLADTQYIIKDLIGFGSNSFVYKAEYRDNLQPNKSHTVLIKELFPYQAEGLISRGEDGRIVCESAAAELFEFHKQSFLRGNAVHLDFSNVRADMASLNINSYESNGTVYTVIGNTNGETLEAVSKRGEIVTSLIDLIKCLINVLEALDIFHNQGFLHLDISPDNILIMPSTGGSGGRRVLLIDYNSVWRISETQQYVTGVFSVKENYSAPEVRLQDTGAVCAASDLFSVCAIFFEYLRGEPLNFAALYGGAKQPFVEMPLLNGVPGTVATRALAIVKKGLRLSPGRRYQSALELKVDLIELLAELTRRRRKRNFVFITAGILFTVMLTLATINASNYFASYPRTQQEIYAVENVATAMSDSLGRLGKRIDSDLNVLTAYKTGRMDKVEGYKQSNDTMLRNQPYSDDYINSLFKNRSAIPLSTLRELLNVPEEYGGWSDDMLENLQLVFAEGSIYPGHDKAEIAELYFEYIEYFTAICYTKLQLVMAPLNSDGKKPILNALPYIPIFGDIFIEQPFISDKNELQSALEVKSVKLQEITVRLKGYGL